MIKINLRILSLLYLVLFLGISSSFSEEQFVYDGHSKRDPLWSLLTAQGGVVNYDNVYDANDLSLQGIIVGQDNVSVALINGVILKLNEKIGQHVLIKIDSESVTLQNGVEEFILRLKKKEE